MQQKMIKSKPKVLPESLEILQRRESMPTEVISGQGSYTSPTSQMQAQLKQYAAEEAKNREASLRQLRQFKAQLIAAEDDLEKEEEERKKKMLEEEEEKKKQPQQGVSGDQALAQTGSAAKKGMGIFGIGQKKKKSFQWVGGSSERKGRQPGI